MVGKIEFLSEDRDFPEVDLKPVRPTIQAITQDFGFVLHQLNIIFLSDQELWKINLDYLGHDTYTDVITFDLKNEDDFVNGEIYLSIDRITENSKNNEVSFMEELNRVIIHGVLHLVGFNDKTNNEKAIMSEKEDQYLKIVKKSFNNG